VELLLVLALLGILSTAATVSLCGHQDEYAIEAAAKDLAAALRFASTEAEIRRKPIRLAFFEAGGAYRVEIADATAQSGFAPVAGRAGRVRRLMHDVRIVGIAADGRQEASMPDALVFDPSGRGFFGTIGLKNGTGQIIDIRVMAVTHQVCVACEQKDLEQDRVHAD